MEPVRFKTQVPQLLIIDDEPSVQKIIQRVFSPSCDVRILSSGKQLEDLLREYSPDLIILDILMPDEDGLSICHKLRRQPRFDFVPIVFISGLLDDAMVRKSYSVGGDFYLPKPLTLEDLQRVVCLFLGLKTLDPPPALAA